MAEYRPVTENPIETGRKIRQTQARLFQTRLAREHGGMVGEEPGVFSLRGYNLDLGSQRRGVDWRSQGYSEYYPEDAKEMGATGVFPGTPGLIPQGTLVPDPVTGRAKAVAGYTGSDPRGDIGPFMGIIKPIIDGISDIIGLPNDDPGPNRECPAGFTYSPIRGCIESDFEGDLPGPKDGDGSGGGGNGDGRGGGGGSQDVFDIADLFSSLFGTAALTSAPDDTGGYEGSGALVVSPGETTTSQKSGINPIVILLLAGLGIGGYYYYTKVYKKG